jgi:hypothetical protein
MDQKWKFLEHDWKPLEHLSHSGVCNYERCPRRYLFSNVMRLKALGDRPALDYGTAMHKGVQAGWHGDLKQALELFKSVWDGVGESAQSDKRCDARAMAQLKEFIRVRQDPGYDFEVVAPPLSTDSTKQISELEYRFAVDIGLEVPLVGRIDAIVKSRSTGQLWPWEFKTTSELGSRFLMGFDMSSQVILYTLAARLSGLAVQGTIVEGCLVAKSSTNSMSIPVFVPEHVQNEALAWLRRVWSDVKRDGLEGCLIPKFSGCHPYGMFGCPGYTCEFEPLCKNACPEGAAGLFERREMEE